MGKLVICIGLGALVVGAAHAAGSAQDLLNAVEDAYWNAQTYQDTSYSKIQHTTTEYQYTIAVSSVVKFKRPKLVYVESRSEKLEGNGLFVFDGDTYWIYRKDLGRYTKTKTLSSDQFMQDVPFADMYVLGMFVPRYTGTSQMLEEALEKLALVPNQKVGGVKCDLLKGSFDRGWIKLWIAKDTKLIVQMTGEYRAEDSSKLAFTETHKNIVLNATFPPTAFGFAKPEGAVFVEGFGVRPGGLGKVDLSGVPNEGGLENGDPCPDFYLGGSSGSDNTPTNQQLKGRKVILSFWTLAAPGSDEPVVNHLAMLQKLTAEFTNEANPQNVTVLTFQLGELSEAQKDTVTKLELKVSIQVDDGTLFRAFRVIESPTVYIIDTRGRIAASLVGQTDKTEQTIRDILAKAD